MTRFRCGSVIGHWMLLLALSNAFAATGSSLPKLHRVQDFVGRVSGQKFGTNVIAQDGTSVHFDEDSPTLDALTESCLPNQWCSLSGWARPDGTLVLLETAKSVTSGGTSTPSVAPPPTPAGNALHPSFDCARAATAVEFLICSSPDLAALDVELAKLYRAARANGATTSGQQAEWVKRCNTCGSEKCVREAYQERIAALRPSGSDK
jgi:hypothetical protein